MTLDAVIDNKLGIRLHILVCAVEASLELRSDAAFDLDGLRAFAGDGQHEVDLRTQGGADEAGLRAVRGSGYLGDGVGRPDRTGRADPRKAIGDVHLHRDRLAIRLTQPSRRPQVSPSDRRICAGPFSQRLAPS
ncbi:hypothetical protein [Nevskia sp.]|uniref:hypothetical protein n=1 Tax=Nevskia sp. TaxID=1929292 RepID=UPI0025D6EC79|nr:hypothetical protein [Nevskia sp.]